MYHSPMVSAKRTTMSARAMCSNRQMLNVALGLPPGLPISVLRNRAVTFDSEPLMKVNMASTPPTTAKSPKSDTPSTSSTRREV